MEGISDIRIIAVDPRRPPLIRKEPYIDLFFELSHKVPKAWAEDFNALASSLKSSATIQVGEGLFIETWVNRPDDVPGKLKQLKSMIASCSERYIAKIAAARKIQDDANSAVGKQMGEQGRLNKIIEELDFA